METSAPATSSACRSYLFVPAAKAADFTAKFLAGAIGKEPPGAVIFDLEDSIADNAKDAAVACLMCVLDERLPELTAGVRVYVRINGCSSVFFRTDIAALEPVLRRAVGLMLPKCASADDLRLLLASLPDCYSGDLIPLVETLEGHRNRRDIFRFTAGQGWGLVAFGAGDMAYELGIERNYSLVVLQRVIADLLLEGRRAGIGVLDSPSRVLPDAGDVWHRRLNDECVWARDNGFVGKMAVHPAQIAVIESVFACVREKESSRRILRMFAEAGDTRACRCPETGDYAGLPSMKSALRSCGNSEVAL